MDARVVVGEEEKNGGLWGSPRAKTSSPTPSAFFAIARAALIPSPPVGGRPVVGSVVMSLTEKIPNCISSSKVDDVSCTPPTRYMTHHPFPEVGPPRCDGQPEVRPWRSRALSRTVGSAGAGSGSALQLETW